MQNETEYIEKVRERLKIKARCETDLVFRAETLARCKEDSVFWCNNFAFTFDPRQEFFVERHLPFILFSKQVELLKWIESLLDNNNDGWVEKSRDTGVSYIATVPVITYRFLFHDFNAKIGSRKEEYVDRPEDPDSLFWKIDYNLRRLPNWMLPEGFDWNKNRTYMKISHPYKTNIITGESANESFARAGRNNLTIFDELGFWPWGKASWEAAGESTTTRLAVSTPPPTGKNSFFYKLGQSGKVSRFTFHFKEDPRKDEAWVQKQREKKSEEEFERELNISFEGALENTVYAQNFGLCEQGDFPYNPDYPLFVSWDFGLDATVLQWYQWDRLKDHWYLIDSYENSNMDIGYYIPFVNGKITSGYTYDSGALQKIKEHEYWKGATHFGDPDVKKRSFQSKGAVSTKQVLQSAGIYVQSKSWAGKTHYDMKQKTIIFLKKLSIDEKHNEYFSDCIRAARYPERTEISQATTAIESPIHDWSSHNRTALEYMADNVPERIQQVTISTYAPRQNIFKR